MMVNRKGYQEYVEEMMMKVTKFKPKLMNLLIYMVLFASLILCSDASKEYEMGGQKKQKNAEEALPFCLVCYEEGTMDDPLYRMYCCHGSQFHQRCLIDFVNYRSMCSICQKPYPICKKNVHCNTFAFKDKNMDTKIQGNCCHSCEFVKCDSNSSHIFHKEVQGHQNRDDIRNIYCPVCNTRWEEEPCFICYESIEGKRAITAAKNQAQSKFGCQCYTSARNNVMCAICLARINPCPLCRVSSHRVLGYAGQGLQQRFARQMVQNDARREHRVVVGVEPKRPEESMFAFLWRFMKFYKIASGLLFSILFLDILYYSYELPYQIILVYFFVLFGHTASAVMGIISGLIMKLNDRITTSPNGIDEVKYVPPFICSGFYCAACIYALGSTPVTMGIGGLIFVLMIVIFPLLLVFESMFVWGMFAYAWLLVGSNFKQKTSVAAVLTLNVLLIGVIHHYVRKCYTNGEECSGENDKWVMSEIMRNLFLNFWETIANGFTSYGNMVKNAHHN